MDMCDKVIKHVKRDIKEWHSLEQEAKRGEQEDKELLKSLKKHKHKK